MQKVYIDSLTIENFGPFYGEHTFKFTELEGRCGILIGGKNGAGKTHLLRGLYLAVVGESGVGDLKRVETDSDATRFSFERSLNRRARFEEQDTVKLQVVISLHDVDLRTSRRVVLKREIRHRPNSPPVWMSYAERSDAAGQIIDEQIIQKLRDAFLPRHLARFFFFDAERSQSINLSHQDIVEGVTRILGLWTYGELESDLRDLIQSKIKRTFISGAGQNPEAKLVEISANVRRNEGLIEVLWQEKENLQRDLHEVEAELLEVEDDLKTLGAVDPAELQKAQNRRDELTKMKAGLDTKLTETWESALPLALLGRYRRELHDYLLSEERRRDWENARSAVEPKVPQVKDDVFGNVPVEFLLPSEVESFYMGRLEDALHRLFHPPPEGIPPRVFVTERNDMSAQIRQRLMGGFSSLNDLSDRLSQIERTDAELRELDQRLRQMQQNAAAFKRGTELHEKRGELIARRNQICKRLSEIASEVANLDVQLVELKRQETNQREVVDKARKGESLASLASLYREVAGEIRSRAAIQLREQISDNVGELWIDIAERSLEFSAIQFDENWECWLVRHNGERVRWEEANPSAGQRQVRMLAFYEALRRLAKLVPPLVVDTPLARLDKEVRASVLDRLYLSGHLSIILSTNAEIDPDGPLFEKVQNQLARAYTLHPHGSPDGKDYEVHVTSDYFGRDIG